MYTNVSVLLFFSHLTNWSGKLLNSFSFLIQDFFLLFRLIKEIVWTRWVVEFCYVSARIESDGIKQQKLGYMYMPFAFLLSNIK
jgi:hypothetical protein